MPSMGRFELIDPRKILMWMGARSNSRTKSENDALEVRTDVKLLNLQPFSCANDSDSVSNFRAKRFQTSLIDVRKLDVINSLKLQVL